MFLTPEDVARLKNTTARAVQRIDFLFAEIDKLQTEIAAAPFSETNDQKLSSVWLMLEEARALQKLLDELYPNA